MSDFVSCITIGAIAQKIGSKRSFIFCFAISSLFGIVLSNIPSDFLNLITCSVILSKLAVTGSFTLCYLATSEYFPIKYTSLVFGICSIFSRIVTIFSSIIAELPEPLPMAIFTTFCIGSVFGSLLLNKPGNLKKKLRDYHILRDEENGKRKALSCFWNYLLISLTILISHFV